MNEEKILQECQEIYDQCRKIINDKADIGYRESIQKMFTIIDVRPEINIYGQNGLEVEAEIGDQSIKTDVVMSDVANCFNMLLEEILISHYRNIGGTFYRNSNSLIQALKEKEIAW